MFLDAIPRRAVQLFVLATPTASVLRDIPRYPVRVTETTVLLEKIPVPTIVLAI